MKTNGIEPNLTHPSVPALFLERLKRILGEDLYSLYGIKGFEYDKLVTVRINLLKISIKEIEEILKNLGIAFRPVSWYPQALVLENITSQELGQTGLLDKGFLYSQALSSLLPVFILDPKPGERVLDLCAAPGSKTTQIAALMNNEGQIVAVENIRGRFYKLKSVLSLLGAEIVNVKMMDGRRYRDTEGFDKILVDAPCSSEGRFKTADKKSYAYWSLRKIKEMVHKQRGLLLSASRLIRPGGTLVYSTCTFAPEENEGVINWFLKKSGGAFKVEPIALDEVVRYPAVGEWEERIYDPDVKNCFLPTKEMEGFFIAKLVKI